jgi:hypothetical protein
MQLKFILTMNVHKFVHTNFSLLNMLSLAEETYSHKGEDISFKNRPIIDVEEAEQESGVATKLYVDECIETNKERILKDILLVVEERIQDFKTLLSNTQDIIKKCLVKDEQGYDAYNSRLLNVGEPLSGCDAVNKNFVLENIRIQTANEIFTLLKLLNDYIYRRNEPTVLFSVNQPRLQ